VTTALGDAGNAVPPGVIFCLRAEGDAAHSCAEHRDKVARNAFLKGESGPALPEIHAASDVYTEVYGKTLAGEFQRKNQ
jgi:hypothetical protein